jgi:signal transduction histidine kinase
MNKSAFNAAIKSLAGLLLVFLWAPPLSGQAPILTNSPLPLLTNIVQIRQLTWAQAQAGYPVQVTGVITYYNHGDLLFIQDSTGGIYIWPANPANPTLHKSDVQRGDLVEVKAITLPGGGDTAIIAAPEFKVLGKGPMPADKPVSIGQLMTGQEDGQWIEIEGIVRSAVVTGGQLTLDIVEGGDRAAAMVWIGQGTLLPCVDGKVRVRGVCAAAFNKRRQPSGVSILVPDLNNLWLTEPPPAEESLLVQPIGDLIKNSPQLASGHRMHVRGAVTLRPDERTIFIQDSTGGLRVQLAREFTAELGDQLEIVGFPRQGEVPRGLEDATATLVAHGAPPVPVAATIAKIQTGQFDARRVKLQGRIVEPEGEAREPGLLLQTGQFFFSATLAQPSAKAALDGFAKGSLVEVTGVCQARSNGSGGRTIQLLMESPADIRVLKTPSWWTVQRTLWAFGGLGSVLVVSLAWVGSLRKQVRRRTGELRAEIEERKRTATRLESEIAERERMQVQIEQIHKELLLASRQAGMAEVATSVLHNVGNVLNSVNTSASVVVERLQSAKADGFARVADLLEQHRSDLPGFFATAGRADQVIDFLRTLAQNLAAERKISLNELAELTRNIEHIKEIVVMQQSYARVSGVIEQVKPAELVEDALRMNAGALERHEVELVREYDPQLPEITLEKHKGLQILVNLIRNAKYACDEGGRPDKRLTVRITNSDDRVRIAIVDNGVGIPPENLTRIFSHGFTTRKGGHGFALHSGALAAQELGGSLTAYSDGPGKGATFVLELPVAKTQSEPCTT